MIWNMTFLSTIGCLFWRQKTAMCLPLSLYHFLCKFSPIFIVCGNKRGCHLTFLFITPMSSTETLFQGWASWSRIRYKHTLSSSNIWRFWRLLKEVVGVEQCLSGKLWVAWVLSKGAFGFYAIIYFRLPWWADVLLSLQQASLSTTLGASVMANP